MSMDLLFYLNPHPSNLRSFNYLVVSPFSKNFSQLEYIVFPKKLGLQKTSLKKEGKSKHQADWLLAIYRFQPANSTSQLSAQAAF